MNMLVRSVYIEMLRKYGEWDSPVSVRFGANYWWISTPKIRAEELLKEMTEWKQE